MDMATRAIRRGSGLDTPRGDPANVRSGHAAWLGRRGSQRGCRPCSDLTSDTSTAACTRRVSPSFASTADT